MTDVHQTTKNRLLDAAERLFAEKGFDGVSVRELAAAADVNVAAVNYHFQGKDNLFVEVVRRRFLAQRDRVLATLDAAVAMANGRPRLDAIVRAIVEPHLQAALVHDEDARVLAVISRELHACPDMRHAAVFREMIVPIFAAFSRALRQARPALQPADAGWVIASVVAQIHHFVMRRVKFDTLGEDDATRAFMIEALPALAAPIEDYVASVADHITRFSTAAIDGLHPEVTP